MDPAGITTTPTRGFCQSFLAGNCWEIDDDHRWSVHPSLNKLNARGGDSQQLRLAECFVARDAGGRAQIQGSEVRIRVRDGETVRLTDFVVQPLGCTRAFIAKNESVSVGVVCRPKTALGLRGEKPEAPRSHRAGSKRGPILVLMDVQRTPIVHSRPAEVAIVDDITQRVNEVQPRTGQRAHPADIASVLRNLRVKKDDMQHK